jgi:hypothetical protein
MDALLIFTVLKMRNSEMKCPAAIMNVTWEIPYNLPISSVSPYDHFFPCVSDPEG